MKLFVRFIIMGVGWSLGYLIIFGLILMVIEKVIGGYSIILEAIQKACAVACGFYTSYKLYYPKRQSKNTEHSPAESSDSRVVLKDSGDKQ